jgi:hypothetical protein
MKRILPALFAITCLASCYNYKVFPREYRHYTYTGEKKQAWVVNPELKEEYKILKRSGIFVLTTDSVSPTVLKIKLNPIQQKRYPCGEPALGFLFTGGQLPALLPDRRIYSFTETNGSNSTNREFELHLATQLWFWNMFIYPKHYYKKAGQCLLGNYYGQPVK